MSIAMSEDQLQAHISQALHDLDMFLHDLCLSQNENDSKRAQLLAYWIKAYTKMLRQEDAFNPKSIPKLSRRQIINCDFGYRIGSELGGLHYAVVLDKHNGFKGNTVTVVPLVSKKDNFTETRHKILLSDGIYRSLLERALRQIDEAEQMAASFVSSLDFQSVSEEERVKETARRYTLIQEKTKNAEISLDKIQKLKKGSIADISQIATVSKIRIKEPLSSHSALYGIKVSERDMLCIEKAFCDQYINKCVFFGDHEN